MITAHDLDALRDAITARSVPAAETLEHINQKEGVPSSYLAGYLTGYVHAADLALDRLEQLSRTLI